MIFQNCSFDKKVNDCLEALNNVDYNEVNPSPKFYILKRFYKYYQKL